MEIKDILIRPLSSEKTSYQLGSDQTYAFEVGIKAGKVQIAQAVASFYDVQVDRVRTLIMRGKVKRFGRRQAKRSNWKKAYVTLSKGHSITI